MVLRICRRPHEVYTHTHTPNHNTHCCIYLSNKVLVAGVVCGDDGEDVPVVLLHDVEHDGRLLLDGGSELKEHGVIVLQKDTQESV